MSFLVHTTKGRVAARVYSSMWIVDCHACANAWHVERFQPDWECYYCGGHYEIVWPAHDTAMSIERLLLMRPLPYTRNWMPGESLHDLVKENGEHGVFDPLKAIPHDPGQALLVVSDQTIRTDQLPVTRQRELKAIGA